MLSLGLHGKSQISPSKTAFILLKLEMEIKAAFFLLWFRLEKMKYKISLTFLLRLSITC